MLITTQTQAFRRAGWSADLPHYVSVSLNGKPTTISCPHTHKRLDLAEKCCAKTQRIWTDIISAGNWEIVQVENNYSVTAGDLWEIRYTATDGREHWQRFYYL